MPSIWSQLPTPTLAPRTSHSRRQAPGHIPRPRNAFILFRSSLSRSGHLPTHLETDHRSISRIAGRIWRSLSEADKAVWKVRAMIERDEHQRRYPHYKYSPQVRMPIRTSRRVEEDDEDEEEEEGDTPDPEQGSSSRRSKRRILKPLFTHEPLSPRSPPSSSMRGLAIEFNVVSSEEYAAAVAAATPSLALGQSTRALEPVTVTSSPSPPDATESGYSSPTLSLSASPCSPVFDIQDCKPLHLAQFAGDEMPFFKCDPLEEFVRQTGMDSSHPPLVIPTPRPHPHSIIPEFTFDWSGDSFDAPPASNLGAGTPSSDEGRFSTPSTTGCIFSTPFNTPYGTPPDSHGLQLDHLDPFAHIPLKHTPPTPDSIFPEVQSQSPFRTEDRQSRFSEEVDTRSLYGEMLALELWSLPAPEHWPVELQELQLPTDSFSGAAGVPLNLPSPPQFVPSHDSARQQQDLDLDFTMPAGFSNVQPKTRYQSPDIPMKSESLSPKLSMMEELGSLALLYHHQSPSQYQNTANEDDGNSFICRDFDFEMTGANHSLSPAPASASGLDYGFDAEFALDMQRSEISYGLLSGM